MPVNRSASESKRDRLSMVSESSFLSLADRLNKEYGVERVAVEVNGACEELELVVVAFAAALLAVFSVVGVAAAESDSLLMK